MPTLSPDEEERRLLLYQQGMTDGEIARITGVTRSAIQKWRLQHNLEPRGIKMSRDDFEKRLELFKKGLSNREIARIEGVSEVAISKWRKMHLPDMPIQRHFHCDTGTKMETALSPEQCSVMRKFLALLITAKKLNPELDVGRFIKEYRKMLTQGLFENT